MKYFKKLVGEHIYLSPKHVDDAEKFTEWLNDFETTDYLGRNERVITVAGEKEWLQMESNDVASFAIVTIKDDELIGTCSIEEINYLKRTGTLGIFIGDNDSRNKGYGTEAIKLILDYGFNYLNLNNIMLQVLEFNERAIACYKKCGFKEFGRRRKCNFLNGKYYDVVNMDILAEEFKEDYIKNKNI